MDLTFNLFNDNLWSYAQIQYALLVFTDALLRLGTDNISSSLHNLLEGINRVNSSMVNGNINFNYPVRYFIDYDQIVLNSITRIFEKIVLNFSCSPALNGTCIYNGTGIYKIILWRFVETKPLDRYNIPGAIFSSAPSPYFNTVNKDKDFAGICFDSELNDDSPKIWIIQNHHSEMFTAKHLTRMNDNWRLNDLFALN